MNYPYVLIVTYGRSGSTLLQGLLNSIDGCLVAGENFNFIFPLYQSYRRLLSANAHVAEGVLGGEDAHLPRHPFFGARCLSPDLFLEDASRLVIGQLRRVEGSEQSRCLGFKEIRYAEALPELEEYLEFLQRILPGSALIFNTRRGEEVARSAWFKKQRKRDVLNRIERLNKVFRTYAETSPNAFIIDYQDCVSKTERLRELFQFLGADYPEAKIDDVLNTPHSFSPTQDGVRRLLQAETGEPLEPATLRSRVSKLLPRFKS